MLAAGGRTYSYDEAGNLTSKTDETGTVQYEYSPAGKMSRVAYEDGTDVRFEYDGLGRKVHRLETYWQEKEQGKGPSETGLEHGQGFTQGQRNGVGKDKANNGNGKGNGKRQAENPLKLREEDTAYLYDGLQVFQEFTGEGSPLAEYMRGNDLVASRQTFGFHGRKDEGREGNLRTRGGLLYYGYDGLGSVTDLTDRTGAEAMQYCYDAFGDLFTGITSPYTTVGFTGKSYDPKAGLLQFYSRWYDPSVGRFTTQDSYLGELIAPASQHRYAYVLNNPVTNIDRWGYSNAEPRDPGANPDPTPDPTPTPTPGPTPTPTPTPGPTPTPTPDPVETWTYGSYDISNTFTFSSVSQSTDWLGNYAITFETTIQYTETDTTTVHYKVSDLTGIEVVTSRTTHKGTPEEIGRSKRIVSRQAVGPDGDSEVLGSDTQGPTFRQGTGIPDSQSPADSRRAQLPDYFTITVGASAVIGVSVHVTVDRYGQVTGGIGPTIGASTPVSMSVVAGDFTALQELPVEERTELHLPTSQELDDFLTGSSFSLSGGYGIGVGLVWSPGHGTGAEAGIYTPQIGAAYQYSWDITQVPAGW